MWDYWLDEPHARRGAAYESPLHGIYAAYMAGPNGSAAPAGTGRALARLLELRMSLDLALDDAAGLLARSSGEGHHLARSSMQYRALEFHKFNRIHDYLMDRLDAARRASISHLIPISRQARALSAGMPDLRGDIVHPGSGLFGAVALPGPNGGAPGPAPGGSYLTCASLVNTFIDGLMHAIPQEFCSSLSGISPDVPEPCDFARLDASVSAHIAQNPVRCIALGRMGDAAIPVASELVRLRWALHGAAAAYGFTSELRAVPHAMPWPWDALQLQRLALYTRHMVIELHILVELCDRMRNAGLDAPGHSTVSEICEDREEVARLRALAVGWDASTDCS